jgi:hypothetical protein
VPEGARCVQDNLKLNVRDIVPSLLAANMIGRLQVRYLHKDGVEPEGKAAKRAKLNEGKVGKKTGCMWTGELDRRQGHLNADCAFQPVACLNQGCAKVVLRCDLVSHQEKCPKRVVKCTHCHCALAHDIMSTHEAQCLSRRVPCRQVCGISIAAKDVAHHESVCPKMIVTCPYAEVGCGQEMARADLDQHALDPAHMQLLLAAVV